LSPKKDFSGSGDDGFGTRRQGIKGRGATKSLSDTPGCYRQELVAIDYDISYRMSREGGQLI